MIEAKCNDDEEGSTMTSVTEPTHRDKKGVEYDYGSWLASGACRMELFALLLARNNSIPAIVSFVFRVCKICVAQVF